MKKAKIKVGGLYAALVNGRFVTVRVDAIREVECWIGLASSQTRASQTRYDVINFCTGHKTTFRSAAKFRCEVEVEQVSGRCTECGGPLGVIWAEYEDGCICIDCDSMEVSSSASTQDAAVPKCRNILSGGIYNGYSGENYEFTGQPKPDGEHNPPYRCHQCGGQSYPAGGRPICCYCGAIAKQ